MGASAKQVVRAKASTAAKDKKAGAPKGANVGKDKSDYGSAGKRAAPSSPNKIAATKATPSKSNSSKAPVKPPHKRGAAESKGLAAVEALLGKAGAGRDAESAGPTKKPVPEPKRHGAEVGARAEVGAGTGTGTGTGAGAGAETGTRAGAKPAVAAVEQASEKLKTAAQTEAANVKAVAIEAKTGATAANASKPAAISPSRFERSLARAQAGEPGPIRLTDLSFDGEAQAAAATSGRIELYKKILQAQPQAQPGRPLVNVTGSDDQSLGFTLLSLYELVAAAQALGRETLQVSLVRLSAEEAKELLSQPPPPAPVVVNAEPLSALELARVNGFMELPLAAIERGENLRLEIDQDSPDFANLVESIRSIGLQNPPVVEVRQTSDGAGPKYVCVSGHRRLLALEAVGLTHTTCALKVFRNERHRALAGLAENINREDLHFLDKADGYGLLIQHGMNAQEIAVLLDSDVRTVGKYIRAAGWDQTVKRRLRELGRQVTTRFLLNMLAAGERSTAELHAMIDRFTQTAKPAGKSGRGGTIRKKLEEFFVLDDVAPSQRAVVEKALRYLGLLR